MIRFINSGKIKSNIIFSEIHLNRRGICSIKGILDSQLDAFNSGSLNNFSNVINILFIKSLGTLSNLEIKEEQFDKTFFCI